MNQVKNLRYCDQARKLVVETQVHQIMTFKVSFSQSEDLMSCNLNLTKCEELALQDNETLLDVQGGLLYIKGKNIRRLLIDERKIQMLNRRKKLQ